MPLLFQVLSSGSKGNSILVCGGKTQILLDAGLSAKELVARLSRSVKQAFRLDALVVSHEHQDHVRGIGVLSRRFDLPVYLSQGTLDNLPPQLGQCSSVQIFHPGTPFTIGDLQLQPFAISHDAAEPAGFIIQNGASRLAVCTDLGTVTHLVKTKLRHCHGLIIEANHDTDMLINGPYPWHLKQRIKSRHGHLSNVETCALLQEIYHSELQAVVFAHMSETNNHPEVASRCFQELCTLDEWHAVHFEIGLQYDLTPAFELA